MLLAQGSLVYFYHSFRQLQRLLFSTHPVVTFGEVVHRAEGVRMLLAQGLFFFFHHSLRQLQRLLLSTHFVVTFGEVVHRTEGVRMLLAQGPLSCFHHSLRQLQRLLSSTCLAVHKCKVAGHSLKIFADIFKRKYPILSKIEAGIDMWHHRLSEPIVRSFKSLRD